MLGKEGVGAGKVLFCYKQLACAFLCELLEQAVGKMLYGLSWAT
jgi:hypothetical protein